MDGFSPVARLDMTDIFYGAGIEHDTTNRHTYIPP